MGATLGLHWGLSQQLLATSEGPKKLVIEVIAVGDDHQSWVLHCWVKDDSPGVERHRKTLARTLRVPDNTRTSVASRTRRLHRGFNRSLDGVKLMIASHLLDDLSLALILEHDAVANEVQESAVLEDAFEQYLQL